MGCTITVVAENLSEIFGKVENNIRAAARLGLWPDSELIVIDTRQDTARIYRISVKTRDDFIPEGFDYTEVSSGRAFHVGMTGRFGPKPDENQMVGARARKVSKTSI